MSGVDMELKKAFLELQEKKIGTEQTLRMSGIQIAAVKRAKQHAALTEKEIQALDDDTKTYESVGRMFILTPKSQVEENIRKKQTQADEKIKNLELEMGYLEKSLKSATDALRELIQQKKDS
ncbi:prefoldin subunit 1 [Cylas formicarius]|uniref:prefoldin subunit 1 n=1 Tax=Cylas formicarius TaxID=197179 RepID=UPI002958DAAE|nr:prefoldin subunit 1 [Cylas formicarius]